MSGVSRPRIRYAVIAALGLTVLPAGIVATASAEPPNCTAADYAGVVGGVSMATSTYLFIHPDLNMFFTDLVGQPKESIRPEVQQRLDANPQARGEMQAIRQPLVDFRGRCGLPDGGWLPNG